VAQRGIREFTAKKLIANNIGRFSGGKIELPAKLVLVSQGESLADYAGKPDFAWLKEERLVVKPDQLFGKRGKHNLVLLDASFAEAAGFIEENMGKSVLVGKTRGILTDFLVEPFIEHRAEYYLAIRTERERDVIYFSLEGGVDIEAKRAQVLCISVPVLGGIKDVDVKGQLPDFPDRETVAGFIETLYGIFVDLGFAFLEINPFGVKDGCVIPLDMVAKLDDTFAFEAGSKWAGVDFPTSFGRQPLPEEKLVESLNRHSGASLKLTVLNPAGTVWTMIAGGGASVIYADTVSDLGWGAELANYGEYSGNPTTEETCVYARTLLGLMTKHTDPGGRKKYLLIGGGVANFTDVAQTFIGISRALREYKEKLREVGVEIYVRRGGPNYQEGLRLMKELEGELGVSVHVYGPETHMTKIVRMALEKSGEKEKVLVGG